MDTVDRLTSGDGGSNARFERRSRTGNAIRGVDGVDRSLNRVHGGLHRMLCDSESTDISLKTPNVFLHFRDRVLHFKLIHASSVDDL